MTPMHIEIKSLAHLELSQITECIGIAFANYFVKMPTDIVYWKNRFSAARVDFNYSYGAFHENKLVGFVIHCIDYYKGFSTAYNTGTGVIPEYRGLNIVDHIYDHALPILKKNGVSMCTLEVIDKNVRAIKVYERIGFEIDADLRFYQGKPSIGHSSIMGECLQVEWNEYSQNLPISQWSTWENTDFTVQRKLHQFNLYLVQLDDQIIGKFAVNPENGGVPQIESSSEKYWKIIFAHLIKISNSLKVFNIDSRRKSLIKYLDQLNLSSDLGQYEMKMELN